MMGRRIILTLSAWALVSAVWAASDAPLKNWFNDPFIQAGALRKLDFRDGAYCASSRRFHV